MGGNMFLEIMGLRFLSLLFAFVLQSSLSAAYQNPHYRAFGRQAALSNSTSTPSRTAISTATPSSNTTCPITYPPIRIPIQTVPTRTACDESGYAYDEYADRCLAEYCKTSLGRRWANYANSSITSWTTKTRIFASALYSTRSDSKRVATAIQGYSSEIGTYELDPVRAVKATPPCCGLCKLQAQTVQLYYWPNQATTAVPSVTGLPKNASAVVSAFAHNGSGIYVDDSGFTFTSPSVYIGFTSLGATDLCGAVGTVLYNTTVGFDPGELSSYETTTTETCYFSPSTVGGTVTQQPSGYLMSTNNRPLNYASVAQNCSTINGYYYFPDDPFNHLAAGDPCHPIIAIPDRIKRLQPDWESCIADAYGGFYDPPKTLQQVFALMPTADPGLTSIAALPQQTPSPPPLQTAQPTLEPEKPSTPSLPPQPQPTPQDPPSSQDPRPADPTSQDSVSQSPASQNPVPQPANPEGPVSQDPSPKSPIPPDTVPQTPTSEKPAAQSPPPQAPISQNPTTDDPMESQAPAPGFTTSITLFPPPVPVEVPQTPPPIVTPTPAGAVTESPSNLPASPSDNVPNDAPIHSPNSIPDNAPAIPSNLIPSNPAADPPNSIPSSSPAIPSPNTSNNAPINPPNNAPNSPPANPPNNAPINPPSIPPNNAPSNPPAKPPTKSPNSAPPAIIIGSQTLDPGQAITVGGQTSTLANSQTTIISGTQFSLDVSGTQVIVGGTSTIVLPPSASDILPNDPVAEPLPASPIVIGSQTLKPGSAITVSDTTISLASSATEIIVGSSTPVLQQPQATVIVPPQPIITIGDQILSIQRPQTTGKDAPSPPVVVIGDQTLTANPSTQFLIGIQTLSPGSAITVSGTTISLAPSATELLVGSSTIAIPIPIPTPLQPKTGMNAAPPLVTLGSLTLTPNSASQLIYNTQTLSVDGPGLIVSGTTISLTTDKSGNTVLVAGTAGASQTANPASATGIGAASQSPPSVSLVTPGASSNPSSSPSSSVQDGTTTTTTTGVSTTNIGSASVAPTTSRPGTGGAVGLRGRMRGGCLGVIVGVLISAMF